MKKIYPLFFLCITCCCTGIYAQKVVDYAVRVSAVVSKSPASITLVWPKETNASVTNYIVYRKAKGAAAFGAAVATVPVTDSFYADKNVAVGDNWEYEIVKTVKGSTFYGYGYINAGIEVPVTEHRGRILLVYDKSILPALQPEFDRLIKDMNGDGWIVTPHGVNQSDSVTYVHSIIESEYNKDKSIKGVLLLGHVPVPYSGGALNYGLNPIDGHDFRRGENPAHNGAFPADVYYGVMNATWTDNDVFDTLGTYAANHNIPGDGKFDQDDIPADAALAVGRIDFHDMPAFSPLTETDLLRRYLNKDHQWRMGNIPMPQRGFVNDNIGMDVKPESLGASGYNNFAAMFGAKNVLDSGAWEKVLSAKSYLWSFSTGYGSFTTSSGVSTSNDYAKDSIQTVFTSAFGSWFGDWNVTNAYLRAALASKGPILTNCYSGRPQWRFHPMALGETIGYCTLLNYNQYANGAGDNTNYFRSVLFGKTDKMIHVSMLGDISLRMHPVLPPKNITFFKNKMKVTVNWTASDDPGVVGYYVYRTDDLAKPFVRIGGLVIGTNIIDDALHNKNYYMVRALKLTTSASGSYYNLSEGIIDTITTDISDIEPTQQPEVLNLYPNPGQNQFHIVWNGNETANGTLKVFDMMGHEVLSRSLENLGYNQVIDFSLAHAATGVYMVRLTNGSREYLQRIVKQ